MLLDVCTVASSSMQTGCVEGRTKTLLMLLCSKATQRSGHTSCWCGAVSAGRGVLDVHMHRARRRRARSTSSHEYGCRHTLDSSAPSTTQCKCTWMRQLPAAAATRVDASSMNAASVYSCSAYEIHVRLARSTSSQDMSFVVSTITTHLHVATTQCKCRSTRQLPAAYCGRC